MAWVVLVVIGTPAAAFSPRPMVELVAAAIVGGCVGMCRMLARPDDASRWAEKDGPLEWTALALAGSLALVGLFALLGVVALAVLVLGSAASWAVAEVPRLAAWRDSGQARRTASCRARRVRVSPG